ncbi:hypothetical protein [Parvicella tangerina]|uniref:Uncharacterized protein n=1 Tax=Parvicella tangerina TaxID=2829795 RepID=A0A916JP44_9FLAO|nr:hypothetical protein [Parvicella tangerina]CAG5085139.1 hypothetical protein CRYO30217_02659 [Parvicella tangerina]
MTKFLLLLYSILGLFGVSNSYCQKYIGSEVIQLHGDSEVKGSFYIDGLGIGLSYLNYGIWDTSKPFFSADLNFYVRRNKDGMALINLNPNMGLGMKFGKQSLQGTISFGLHSKLNLRDQGFYTKLADSGSSRIALGAYFKPSLLWVVNDKINVSFYVQTRYDFTPTYRIYFSTVWNVKVFEILSGIKISFKIKNKDE